MNKAEFVLALVHCLCWDPYENHSNCYGCPLLGKDNCRYALKRHVIEYFITEKPNEEKVKLDIPLDTPEED